MDGGMDGRNEGKRKENTVLNQGSATGQSVCRKSAIVFTLAGAAF